MSTTWISGLFTEQTKLKACRYLLHHYLGELLKDNVSLEQLSVDIFKGKGTIEHLSLDEEVKSYIYSLPNVFNLLLWNVYRDLWNGMGVTFHWDSLQLINNLAQNNNNNKKKTMISS